MAHLVHKTNTSRIMRLHPGQLCLLSEQTTAILTIINIDSKGPAVPTVSINCMHTYRTQLMFISLAIRFLPQRVMKIFLTVIGGTSINKFTTYYKRLRVIEAANVEGREQYNTNCRYSIYLCRQT